MKRMVTLALKNGDAARPLYPVTEAASVYHERGDASPSTVKKELDSLNDALQGAAPGLVARVDALEAGQYRPYNTYHDIRSGETFVCPAEGTALFHIGGNGSRFSGRILAGDGVTVLMEIALYQTGGRNQSCTLLLPKGTVIECTEVVGANGMCRFLPLKRGDA